MNLASDWVEVLRRNQFDAVHWSQVGDPRATDLTIMQWARDNGHVVFTHDLDFGTVLALTQSTGPSVVQVRAADVMPVAIEAPVVRALRQFAAHLEAGAIVVVDPHRSRVRLLPIK
jgi:predicted nuclease of predicted toxin-antitoxin system